MADKKPIYQPWNEDEFQSSLPARGMTHIQKWMYKSLLQSAFFCKTSPYLPDDDATLWVLSGSGSLDEWKANRGIVLSAFDVRSENGLFSHHRVIEDWNRVIAYRKKMKKLAKRSAEARAAFSARSTDGERTQNKRNDSKEELEVKESEMEKSDLSRSLEHYADRWN